jgi:hypothetical protein
MWSDKARQAAAAARKASGTTRRSKGGRTLKRGNNAQRAQGVRFGAEAHGRVGPYGKVTKTQPHKALPNTPVNHSLAAPMKAPGVAKPTGPNAFTHRAPGGKVGNSRMTPTAQANNYKSQAKSPRTPVFGTKKRYPSSKLKKGK